MDSQTTQTAQRGGRLTGAVRWTAVALMSGLVIAATVVGAAQSYSGLYNWALAHGHHGWKAQSWPLLVDTFIAVGEIGLFLLAIDGHKLLRRGLSWLDLLLPAFLASVGWTASLVFQVEQAGQDFGNRATAAVPAISAMLGLTVLLRTIHRYVTAAREQTSPAESTPKPTLRSEVTVPSPEGAQDQAAQSARVADLAARREQSKTNPQPRRKSSGGRDYEAIWKQIQSDFQSGDLPSKRGLMARYGITNAAKGQELLARLRAVRNDQSTVPAADAATR